MFCPKCGANNPEGAQFCAGCGSAIRQNTAPAASTTPQQGAYTVGAIGASAVAVGRQAAVSASAPRAGMSLFDYVKIGCAAIAAVCVMLSWLKIDFSNLLSIVASMSGSRISMAGMDTFTYSLLGIGDALNAIGDLGTFLAANPSLASSTGYATVMMSSLSQLSGLVTGYKVFLAILGIGLFLTVLGAGMFLGGSRKDTLLRIGLIVVAVASVAFIVVVMMANNSLNDTMTKFMTQMGSAYGSSAYAQIASAMRDLIGVTFAPIVTAIAAVAGTVCSFLSSKAL